MEQLEGDNDVRMEERMRGYRYLLPIVPSLFFVCHHFPCLSITSRSSPFSNDISLGSSGFAVSAGDIFNQILTWKMEVIADVTHMRTMPSLGKQTPNYRKCWPTCSPLVGQD